MNPVHTGSFNSVGIVSIDGIGTMTNNTITFCGGSGDCVFAVAYFSGNTIVSGNEPNDYVSVTGNLSTSNGNTISLGNGNNDSVTLPGNLTGSGDTIITGTGSSATVTGGSHIAGTFGFSISTGGTAIAQTTVTGAELGDNIVVGNVSGGTKFALGNTLVQDGAVAGLTAVREIITYLQSHGSLKANHTYTADSGGIPLLPRTVLAILVALNWPEAYLSIVLVASRVLTLGV